MTTVERTKDYTRDQLVALVREQPTPERKLALIERIKRESAWKPWDYQVPPPGDWATWLFLGGRGTGKTDTDAAWMNDHAQGPPCDTRVPGGHRMSIVGPTLGDVVESCINGPSGLIAHNPDVKLVSRAGGSIALWPNGAQAKLFGGWTPNDVERFRAGGNRCACWIEEAAAIPQLDKVWEQIPFGHRLGKNPRTVLSTTPKARAALRKMVGYGRHWMNTGEAPHRFARVALSSAETAQNLSLDEDWVESIYAEYGDSRFGRQELKGELLDDYEGALWQRSNDEGTGLDDLRIEPQDMPTLTRRYVGVDPSAWGLKLGDRQPEEGEIARGVETGIVVSGIDARRHTYTLADYSARCTPAEWGEKVLDAYYRWQCSAIVFETNAGGAMGPSIIQGADKTRRLERPSEDRPPIRFYREKPNRIGVVASDGKRARAEPVAALAEMKRHHMVGVHPYLEDQLTGWNPDESWSPDRLDAFVWSITALKPWRTPATTSMGSEPRGDVSR
jgi:phage terminase large subunit-like protein